MCKVERFAKPAHAFQAMIACAANDFYNDLFSSVLISHNPPISRRSSAQRKKLAANHHNGGSHFRSLFRDYGFRATRCEPMFAWVFISIVHPSFVPANQEKGGFISHPDTLVNTNVAFQDQF
jgi:hypothetical protein